MVKYRDQRGIGQVEEETSSPDAQVQTWLAWRGRARMANQARPGEVFTGAATAWGATPPGMLRLAPARPSTEPAAQLHHDHHRGAQPASGKGGDETSAAGSAGHVPEWDPTSDLLGEETASKSVRRRQERVERGAFGPRWRRRNSPESARIARRRRRRFRGRRRESRGGEERDWGRSGSVWLTQVLAGWVRPSRVGWAGPMGQSPFANSIQLGKKYETLFFLFKINSNLKLNQFYLI
jgi:hypothetical protein